MKVNLDIKGVSHLCMLPLFKDKFYFSHLKVIQFSFIVRLIQIKINFVLNFLILLKKSL